MPNRLWIAAVLAATPILAMSPVAFPASHEPGCVHAAQGARATQRALMSLMKRHDRSAERKLHDYYVERVKTRDVEIVNDHTSCARAALAYNTVVRDPNPDRRVSLIRVGDRYVVTDPAFKPDRHGRAVTFDSTLTEPLAMVVE